MSSPRPQPLDIAREPPAVSPGSHPPLLCISVNQRSHTPIASYASSELLKLACYLDPEVSSR